MCSDRGGSQGMYIYYIYLHSVNKAELTRVVSHESFSTVLCLSMS